ncbi:MAG: ABC transporter ATP-binding protein [Armatimonadota bacterium]|nr:MAG: ABC transporter ATP-binding protein [Armatimonadota bacterium]
MTPLIRLKDIKKTYLMGRVPVPALRGVDMEIADGEMVAIMGPSGSGKTTLLNIIGLLDTPSVGSYRLDGDEVAKLSDRRRSQLRNKRLGFVFQVYNLLPRLTALENVMIPLVYGGVKKKDRRPQAEAAMRAVDLQDRMRHRPTELSGGEQQRVAIARALVNDPSVILADEPTGNLDSKSGEAIMDLIQQLHEDRKVTVAVVTHDSTIASRAERVVQLRDGTVVDGSSQEGAEENEGGA